MDGEREELQSYIGENIVMDTDGFAVYIGRLEAVGRHFITLTEVDVHDVRDGNTTREKYILEACKYGVKKNRREVLVYKKDVVSLSKLTDVIPF